MPQKSRWGLPLFISSFLFAGFLIFISFQYPFNRYAQFYITIVPIAGIILSILSFFIGHFSYPRVHNLKVYVIGCQIGFFGLGYFILFCFPISGLLGPVPHGYTTALYIVIFINLLSVLFLPSFVKYRTAKHVVLVLIPVECLLLLIFRFSPNALHWIHVLAFNRLIDPAFWIGSIFFITVLIGSIVRIKNEFYLGGIVAGVAFLYAFSWTSKFFFNVKNPVELLFFAGTPLFLEIGILVHWFLRMEHRIAYDPLLHIYNRDYCSKIISEQSSLNLMPPLSVAMVDIDHFKSVNDTYGHQAGDQVLYAVAQTISKEVVPAGIVCRYGGEEIVVFFPRKTTRQVIPVIENMRKTIEKVKTKTATKAVAVTVSCGISCREEPGQTIIDVIHAADKALYKAKEGGRNQVKTSKTTLLVKKK